MCACRSGSDLSCARARGGRWWPAPRPRPHPTSSRRRRRPTSSPMGLVEIRPGAHPWGAAEICPQPHPWESAATYPAAAPLWVVSRRRSGLWPHPWGRRTRPAVAPYDAMRVSGYPSRDGSGRGARERRVREGGDREGGERQGGRRE
jgi:hypothetical protein